MDPGTDRLASEERNVAKRKLEAIAKLIGGRRVERQKPHSGRAENLQLYRRARDILGDRVSHAKDRARRSRPF